VHLCGCTKRKDAHMPCPHCEEVILLVLTGICPCFWSPQCARDACVLPGFKSCVLGVTKAPKTGTGPLRVRVNCDHRHGVGSWPATVSDAAVPCDTLAMVRCCCCVCCFQAGLSGQALHAHCLAVKSSLFVFFVPSWARCFAWLCKSQCVTYAYALMCGGPSCPCAAPVLGVKKDRGRASTALRAVFLREVCDRGCCSH